MVTWTGGVGGMAICRGGRLKNAALPRSRWGETSGNNCGIPFAYFVVTFARTGTTRSPGGSYGRPVSDRFDRPHPGPRSDFATALSVNTAALQSSSDSSSRSRPISSVGRRSCRGDDRSFAENSLRSSTGTSNIDRIRPCKAARRTRFTPPVFRRTVGPRFEPRSKRLRGAPCDKLWARCSKDGPAGTTPS